MILIIDMNQRKDSLGFGEFARPVASAVGADRSEVRHYTESIEPEGYSHIILSGTPLRDNEYMNHIRLFQWVKKCDKPVLGICAGMQAIANVYGSGLEKNKEIGMTDIETVKDNPLFRGRFKAYELHNFAVCPTDKFDILARSGKCPQAIKHKDKPTYGVLFHPEVRNMEMLDRFIML
jgi:GMP synthase-like glutamine amidotransferase